MDSNEFLHQADNEYIDSLYNKYKKDPQSLDESWQKFFQGFDLGSRGNGYSATAATPGTGTNIDKELRVAGLIHGYRSRGHLLSTTNPIRPRKNRHPKLELEDYGLSEADLGQEFQAGEAVNLGRAKLSDILAFLKDTYCHSIGVEYNHIKDTERRNWFRNRFETTANKREFSLEKKKRILHKLNEAVVFENFLNKKYVGQKRFSLEGGENTIPALDAIISMAVSTGTNEVVVGMAHRGRLNVLANILGKTYEYIFSEFEGFIEPEKTMGDGDVKYHLGFASQVDTFDGSRVFLKLMPNPSHLEAVDAVAQGFAKAKTELFYDGDKKSIFPVLIHGDAALAGQGIVYEIAQMSQLKGYSTGGTLHFVINNQIGFTTDFDEARSSTYSTGVGYVVDSPILHVNGDDAEAVVYAVELATEYRQKFQQDVYVDMVCYRKHGHNEADEPKFTQPQLYNLINQHKDPREVYVDTLIERGEIEKAMAKKMEKEFKESLQARLNMVKKQAGPFKVSPMEEEWKALRKSQPEDFQESPDTSVKKEDLDKVIEALTNYPEGFHALKKVEKLLEDQRKLYYEDGKLNWSLGELTAYGTLLLEGNDVRLSGQDSIRGTFSHRHAEIRNEDTSESYNFLNNMKDAKGKLCIYNSLLSEYAALGFEYGYSLSSPNTLSIWEAQFGDFSNGAQVAIDQYIVSGESKWQKMTGLCLFLPHGYEGQGPEHSNARPERFLQLAAEYNMVIANCTTPANFFHLLRRQLAWPFRKPLVVFTPKSLLRHERVISPVEDFTDKCFIEVIDDPHTSRSVKRVLLCSGKIYYDLLAQKEEKKVKNVAIIRLEQLYPWPEKGLEKIYAKYKNAEYLWVQEEPKNMGAWYFINSLELPVDLKCISRKKSASPATGYHKVHIREQNEIVSQAVII